MADFKLPAGWYRRVVEELVDNTLPPLLGPLSDKTAWKYVYANVLWFESKVGGRYLHLNDKLKDKSGRDLAKRGEEYLAANLAPESGVSLEDLVNHLGRAYADERGAQGLSRERWQRNNVTGNGFEATMQVLIDRLCGVLPSRSPDLSSLRGFELAPKGYHSRPDLALFSATDFRVLVSTKWTMRKERLGTFLHEAYFYKQRRADLQVAFVVSEFNLNILEHLVNDPLVDRTYHVHLPMFLAAHQPLRDVADGGSVSKDALLKATSAVVRDYQRWVAIQQRLFDLSQLFADIRQLRQSAATPRMDPVVEEDADDDDDDDD